MQSHYPRRKLRNRWDLTHLKFGRSVAIIDGETVGWCALTAVSSRCVYAGVAEVSVYVATDHNGKGVGTRLLRKLISEAENNEIWTLQSSIFPENSPSIRLHINHGFREVGVRERIGMMDGKWRDTILLERRSKLIN
ncbi:MAG: N-acetyltransferase family protein [Pedobacter sp.]|nr:MAG: N-acetyltransferase family protein [Pedobacter sp.]